jgi:hypothetical protein
MDPEARRGERRYPRWDDFEAPELGAMITALGECDAVSIGAKLADEIESELLIRCKEGDHDALDVVYNGTYAIDTSSLERQVDA